MLTDARLTMVRYSMSSEMSLACMNVLHGIKTSDDCLPDFGWFGKTFFESDEENCLKFSGEGKRLVNNKKRIGLPFLLSNEGEYADFLHSAVYLNTDQICLLNKAHEQRYYLPEDGSEDVDALFLFKRKYVWYDVTTNTIRTIPCTDLELRDIDSELTESLCCYGLAAIMADLGMSAMSKEQRRKTVNQALKMVENFSRCLDYPVYDEDKEDSDE